MAVSFSRLLICNEDIAHWMLMDIVGARGYVAGGGTPFDATTSTRRQRSQRDTTTTTSHSSRSWPCQHYADYELNDESRHSHFHSWSAKSLQFIGAYKLTEWILRGKNRIFWLTVMVKMVKIVDIVKYQQGNPLQETVMQRDVRRRNDARDGVSYWCKTWAGSDVDRVIIRKKILLLAFQHSRLSAVPL